MADPLLVPFFEGVDMKKQARKQVGLWCCNTQALLGRELRWGVWRSAHPIPALPLLSSGALLGLEFESGPPPQPSLLCCALPCRCRVPYLRAAAAHQSLLLLPPRLCGPAGHVPVLRVWRPPLCELLGKGFRLLAAAAGRKEAPVWRSTELGPAPCLPGSADMPLPDQL
jgi:hypothetical protein